MIFHAHQLHLPNDLRTFQYLTPPVYHGPEALVFDGQATLDAPIFARSYLFRQRWLEIFLTFDQHLQPRPDSEDSFPFAFNCDLTTPYILVDNHGYTIDLFLDVVVAADRHSYQIRDHAAFDQAVQTACIPAHWSDAVERDVAWLLQLLETQQFLPLLNQIVPFPTRAPEQLLSVFEKGQVTEDSFPDLSSYPFATTALQP